MAELMVVSMVVLLAALMVAALAAQKGQRMVER